MNKLKLMGTLTTVAVAGAAYVGLAAGDAPAEQAPNETYVDALSRPDVALAAQPRASAGDIHAIASLELPGGSGVVEGWVDPDLPPGGVSGLCVRDPGGGVACSGFAADIDQPFVQSTSNGPNAITVVFTPAGWSTVSATDDRGTTQEAAVVQPFVSDGSRVGVAVFRGLLGPSPTLGR